MICARLRECFLMVTETIAHHVSNESLCTSMVGIQTAKSLSNNTT